MPVEVVAWGPNVGSALALAWATALLFGVIAVICLVALTLTLLVRR
jgi:hypothetical protein